MKQIINGVEVEMTADEIAARLAEEEAWANRLIPASEYQAAIEKHIDAVAGQRGYSSGISCASYKDSTNPAWAAEAAAFIAWRDEAWAYALSELDDVMNGHRPRPSVAEFVSELKPMEWPA